MMMTSKNTTDSPEFWADPLGGQQITTSLAEYTELANRPEEFFVTKDIREFRNDFQVYLDEKKYHVAKYVLPFKQTGLDGKERPIDFEFRPGELTLLAGENGSGKSLLLGQIGLHLLAAGASLYIASFEMAPVRTIERMLTQVVCSREKRIIEELDIEMFFNEYAARLHICDLQRKVEPDELIRLLEAAVKYYRSDVLFVDSLMMCVKDDMDKSETDYAMARLVEFARVNNVHIVVVAHCRKRLELSSKMYNVFDAASKDSIKGSSNITNIAFNIFVLARDYSKIQKRAEGKDIDDSKPDCVLNLCKQRNGAFEGYIKLWRDNASLNFCTSMLRIPVRPTLSSTPAPEEEKVIEPYF
jgi:twinkle protein|nr:MAG TPA: DNA directed DNA polymerase [Caudoviricetes sp.]